MEEIIRISTPIDGKNILLGVTGSIAAYKAAELASKLTQAGGQVTTLFTPSALQFISAVTFQSVTGREALTDTELWGMRAHVLHVNLAHTTDLFVIAPATANTIAKLAHGIADNLLTISALAYHSPNEQKPLIIAPAMDGGMFSNPATQTNLEILKKRGAIIVGPEAGHLASGLVMKGRMSEPATLLGHIRCVLGRNGALKGRRVVVTAGGTQEPIDPVRVITNHSSGKQGYALAQAAVDAGAQVTLVSAPVSLPVPVGVDCIEVKTAEEMDKAVLQACKDADVLLMAAAVADYRPVQAASQKIKKQNALRSVELEPTPDILKAIAALRKSLPRLRVVVGFAAETEALLANARQKLEAKNLDMIVANDVSAVDAGFGVDTNRVSLLYRDGKQEALPLLSKNDVAGVVLQRVADSFPA